MQPEIWTCLFLVLCVSVWSTVLEQSLKPRVGNDFCSQCVNLRIVHHSNLIKLEISQLFHYHTFHFASSVVKFVSFEKSFNTSRINLVGGQS